MGLGRYREKRDFGKTPEPAGKVGRRRRRALRYVIQKHDATRLHYDFRLEMEGVLRSWAVPKGPSLDPADRRYAAHVEDHPLAYGGFEGVIPEGEYGAGPVVVWDRGTWEPEGDPVAAYRKGHLEFRLDGERLRGRWMLVRMKGRGRDAAKDWLLIKRQDEAARPGDGEALLAERPESVVSGRNLVDLDGRISAKRKARTRERTLTRTARTKPAKTAARKARRRAATTIAPAAKHRPAVAAPGRRAGARRPARSAVDPESVEGARPAVLPAAVAPQLATLVAEAPAGDAWLHEIKFDGYRILARVAHGEARLLSRRGREWTDRFVPVARAAAALPVRDAVLDGEVTVVLEDGRTDFQALQNAMSERRDEDLTYYAFDLLHLDGHDLRAAPLAARKKALRSLLAAAPPSCIRYSDHVAGRGPEFFRAACGRQLEGIVSKRADAPYSGVRGRDWVKVKCHADQEVVVVGWTDPSGSREAFGALLVGVHDATGALRYAGKVGTGYTDATLRDVMRHLAKLERETPAVADPPRGFRARGAHWVEPKLVAEVRFTEWTRDGKLRHPSFKGLRMDKPAKDVVRERPKAAPAPDGDASAPAPPKSSRRATKAGAPAASTAAAANAGETRVAGIRISNPDRVLDPDLGLTKADLARYYESVADRIVPHVADRLLTLVRCPEGRARQCFYQKHARPGIADVVRRVGGVDEHGDYLAVDSVEGLVALVQFGVLEFHVWGSRTDRLEEPDRMILDVDPDPSVGWPAVAETVRELRRRLEAIDLVSFLKTTGGKGLHVVVPLVRRKDQDWDVVKEFSRLFVGGLVRDLPDRYTANPLKSRRKGRLFLDYLRNGRGATAIAPYSTRAKPGATVAVPITWEELDAGVRSDSFDVKTTLARLARQRKDPWDGIDRVRQSLTASMRRAVGLR